MAKARFRDEWTAPVWKDEDWFRFRGLYHLALPTYPAFPHISETDPTQIAFCASHEHGIANRWTRMRPGKFLNSFFRESLTAKQIAFCAEWWARGDRLHQWKDAKLLFASSPDDIFDVYARGPQSCMKGFEAVKVYGAGDLAIAYLEVEDFTTLHHQNDPVEKKVVARALCWPEKRVYSRIYPSQSNWMTDGFSSAEMADAAADVLGAKLRALGYKSQQEVGREVFEGARLLAIPNNRTWVMPYIDYFRVVAGGNILSNDPDFRLSCDLGIDVQSTDGMLNCREMAPCDRCGKRYRLQHFIPVFGRWDQEPLDRMWWCHECKVRWSFYCMGSREYYPFALAQRGKMDNELPVNMAWAKANAVDAKRWPRRERNSLVKNEAPEYTHPATGETMNPAMIPTSQWRIVATPGSGGGEGVHQPFYPVAQDEPSIVQSTLDFLLNDEV